MVETKYKHHGRYMEKGGNIYFYPYTVMIRLAGEYDKQEE
jgi:hypothetical protein